MLGLLDGMTPRKDNEARLLWAIGLFKSKSDRSHFAALGLHFSTHFPESSIFPESSSPVFWLTTYDLCMALLKGRSELYERKGCFTSFASFSSSGLIQPPVATKRS